MNPIVFLDPPEDFSSSVEAAGCYLEYEDKILFLRRHPEKTHGNTWGIPGGKLEDGELPRSAVIREIYEEIGLKINHEELVEIGKLYVRTPDIDYVFYLYRKNFKIRPSIELGLEEHLEAKWVTAAEASELPLIPGGKEALNFYNSKNS